MKTKNLFLPLSVVSLLITVSTIFSGCKKDDDDVKSPNIPNESELITTVKLIFNPNNPSVAYEFVYRDIDGIGGNVPTIDTILLATNSTYNVQLLLLDETKSPVDTISNEVMDEANDHLFIYTPSSSAFGISISDSDSNTPPLQLGLLTNWTTFNSYNGSVQIVLKHQPGIKNGDPSLGESDIEITMPVRVTE